MKRGLTLAGIALAILGFYGPWITSARGLAALTYNALDLAEFLKFIGRAGIASITREWFLVPIAAAALALALWANSLDQRSRVLRHVLTLAAVLFSFVPLPPYPFLLRAYASTEDRASFWLSVAAVAGVVLIFVLGSHIAGRWRGAAFVALAVTGAVPAAWEFFTRALPAISKVYGSPAVMGWGPVVTLLGFVLIIVGAVMRET